MDKLDMRGLLGKQPCWLCTSILTDAYAKRNPTPQDLMSTCKAHSEFVGANKPAVQQ